MGFILIFMFILTLIFISSEYMLLVVVVMPVIGVSLDSETYTKLCELARESGLSISSLVKMIVKEYLKSRGVLRVTDQVNYQDVLNKLSELTERVSNLETRLSELTNRIQTTEVKKKVTAMDILKREGFIDERELYHNRKVRDPKGLIQALEKQGAKVFEVKDSRIIVDPELYESLMSKLENISTSKENELKKVLDEKEFKLLELLREGGYIFFDAVEKKWKLVEG
jgi:Ribbon-helix-helix protein, copG family.